MAVWIPQFDLRCEKCSDGQKKFNGCEEDSTISDRWVVRDWSFQRCPIKLITKQTNDFISAYNLMKLGMFPYGNGWLKESNKFVEAIRVIDTETRLLEQDNLRKLKR